MPDDLLARIQRLEDDNRRLSALVDQLSTRDIPAPDDGPVNRRGLLKRAGGVALGVTAAGTAGQLLNPTPAAATVGNFLLGTVNYSDDQTSYRYDHPGLPGLIAVNVGESGGIAFLGKGTGTGVTGVGDTGPGVIGSCPFAADDRSVRNKRAGVVGFGTQDADGVMGVSATNAGVRGTTESGTGVAGFSVSGDGVSGKSRSSAGVVGTSDTGFGVTGVSESAFGTRGHSTSGTGVVATSTSGYALVAQAFGPAPGVSAYSANGRGGVFEGGLAALRLTPGRASTHPTAGETGDLYVDSVGQLWYCRRGGVIANWVSLSD